jgi:hypothetical protein
MPELKLPVATPIIYSFQLCGSQYGGEMADDPFLIFGCVQLRLQNGEENGKKPIANRDSKMD